MATPDSTNFIPITPSEHIPDDSVHVPSTSSHPPPPQQRRIIGLIGYRGSGKSTVASYLTTHHDFIELTFGLPVKQVCQQLFLLSDDQLNDRVLKESIDPRWGKSPREMFQWLGTNIMRDQFSPSFWTTRLSLQFEQLPPSHSIVISDIRFSNELDTVINLAATHCIPLELWYIQRNDILHDTASLHPSESNVTTLSTAAHRIIHNQDITLDTLHSIIEQYLIY